jgi:hypothetical protein
MREDMFKVIVERPRRGARSWPRARNRLAGEDDLPTKIGVRREIAVKGLQSRWLNENLRPLERFIGKQVGRPWDEVFSEIAETLAPGHVVKAHVRLHISDFVAHVAIGKEGEWLGVHTRRGSARPMPWRQPYYVDPRDGLLKDSALLWKRMKINPRRRREPEVDLNIRRLDSDRELRRVDGVWYEFVFDERPRTGRNPRVFDLVSRSLVPSDTRHAIAKRQLSRAELRMQGIANTHMV